MQRTVDIRLSAMFFLCQLAYKNIPSDFLAISCTPESNCSGSIFAFKISVRYILLNIIDISGIFQVKMKHWFDFGQLLKIFSSGRVVIITPNHSGSLTNSYNMFLYWCYNPIHQYNIFIDTFISGRLKQPTKQPPY